MTTRSTDEGSLHTTGDAQVANLAEHALDLAVEVSLGVLLARVGVEVLLHLSHAGIGLGTEAQLDLDERLEARVEVWHAQVDELGEFGEELLVERLVGRLGQFGFAFGAWQLGGVLVGFLYQLLDFGACGVVVEELVVAFLDA